MKKNKDNKSLTEFVDNAKIVASYDMSRYRSVDEIHIDNPVITELEKRRSDDIAQKYKMRWRLKNDQSKAAILSLRNKLSQVMGNIRNVTPRTRTSFIARARRQQHIKLIKKERVLKFTEFRTLIRNSVQRIEIQEKT